MLPYPGTPLRVGSIGSDVRMIQEYLNAIGAGSANIPLLAVDGIFGPRTEAAVTAFQQQSSITQSGIVGPITWAEIMRQYAAVSAFSPAQGGNYHAVVPGDTLWLIAQRFGTTVDELRAQNNLPGNCLNAGQILLIPSSAQASQLPFFEYTVTAGDTLWLIAQRFDTNVDAIRSLNNFDCCDVVYIGQILRIPRTTTSPILTRTVVIDAGHGGHDFGATLGSRLEKDDNLRLALAVQQILLNQGQRVIMTRSTDVFIPLAERSAISNNNNADLFVSIHRNSATNSAANGVDNFISTTASATAALYASNVLSEVVNAGVQNNGGVIRANFAVLRNTRAPAMLLEVGFISNARDNQLFDQNFNAYAEAIARGIMESLYGPSVPPSTFFFYTVVPGDTPASIARRFGTTVDTIMSLNQLTRGHIATRQVLKIPSS